MDFARAFLRIVALILAIAIVLMVLGTGLFLAMRDMGTLRGNDCIVVMPEGG